MLSMQPSRSSDAPEGCDLRLDHPSVSHRHTYLQAVLGRIYCVNLTSHGQTLWPDGPRKADWLELDETVGIGPYKVRLVETMHPGQEHDRTPAGFSPLDPYAGQCGPMPKVEITFLTGAGDRSKSTVTRLITLAGSSARCKFRFEDPSVSSVHFSFVLTPDGLWVVDLAGRDGVTVNRQPVRSAKLRDKDKLLAGTFLMRVEQTGESLARPRDSAITDARRRAQNAAPARVARTGCGGRQGSSRRAPRGSARTPTGAGRPSGTLGTRTRGPRTIAPGF